MAAGEVLLQEHNGQSSQLLTSPGSLPPTSAPGRCLTRSYRLWWTPSLIGDITCRVLNTSLWFVQTIRPSVTSASPRSYSLARNVSCRRSLVTSSRELNILPDLLSHNPAMYPVRGNEDPQVTVILESLILPDSGSPLPQTPFTPSAVPPQLLVIAPAPSSELDPPMALHGTLPHKFWWPSTPLWTARPSAQSCHPTLHLMVPILLRIR
ncbi:hypothetical protein DSO57_1006451 [Entomophthora muscae]|uniref:Uncharacterized protein n=1 Tax=Entomophthora muscae TaxID=34485 RepID=A0ACC2UTA5_9FUNG|nr:hypothetical protein DSO57_1006451 [Entomophthora muscae]